MAIFQKKTKAESTEPYKERRRREVSADIKKLTAEMESPALRERLFREKHFVLVSGKLFWRCDGFAQRADRDQELRALEQERDRLILEWHRILAEHAALTLGK